MIKELWLKFSNKEEYEEKESDVINTLKEYEGDAKVICYLGSEQLKRTVSDIKVRHDGEIVQRLEGILGSGNVKYVEKVETYNAPVEIPKILQIIPCTDKLYAVFRDEETGEEFRKRVLMHALCDDGIVWPLLFDREYGVELIDDCVSEQLQILRYEIEDGETSGLSDALDRLNGTLESISNTLEDMNITARNIDTCIVESDYGNFLRVGGYISNEV